MENFFKKFVYTGVGLVSLTKDKVQKLADELVDDNKLSVTEGKKLVEDFLKNTDNKRIELENQLKDSVEKVVKKFNFASHKEVNDLETRIKELEAALSEKE
ncbi:MAG: phasin family protein [Bacteroidales bacterium]|nr:phasin family protein [Bacteroidales bacterium]